MSRPPRPRWRLRLGTRLALGVGALSLVVFAVVGTALTMYMRQYQERQLAEQMKLVQIVQTKDAKAHGTVERRPYYGWYTAVYEVKDGHAELRRPADVPAATGALAAVAEAQPASGSEHLTRTAEIPGEGAYLLRACSVERGVVLVSAAPLADVRATTRRLITVQVVTFAAALVALVVAGRAVLRRGLRPLSDLAATAHDITSHDLTDSGRLPVRADGRSGAPEIQELRSAFNTMLEHIDDSLVVRAEAERRLRRFVADASHELRTPLMSVRGYADLFQYAPAHSPEERDRHLARLRAEAARMGVLLDDLLLLARLDAAEVEAPLRPEETDLVELVRRAADAFRASHPDRPLTVTTGPGELVLRLDPARIRQVVDNLLTNAAVHTPAGTKVSVEVTVEAPAEVPAEVPAGAPVPGQASRQALRPAPRQALRRASARTPAAASDGFAASGRSGGSGASQGSEGAERTGGIGATGATGVSGVSPGGCGAAVVRVTDAGPGIPAADRGRIFDRFYRVDKARTRDRGGSGLGLAVVRSLVEAHGGTVDVTGGPGATTFTLRIPLTERT
ncbi:two-component system OmpR family sensor kinase [Streptomyces sp. B3I7]|uniref:sensor histidine kinase n=1 Tax=Streptomyces sp. B3I7 TaxID=3042269 RepID=UPI0027806B90|nr:HAMP domain-containing sensor histidine kinase [Streptomyces sp. B3I7]MDQ0809529.1 two-component system OmpR family sensor kinase [Streptomyces sp. B3I7]